MNDFQVTYFGILRACTSWGKVGRELSLALIAQGADVNIYERKGFLYRADFDVSPQLLERVSQSFRDDVVFTFEHPGVYGYLKAHTKVGLLTYETTVVPSHWVEEAEKHLDILLLPSQFCRDIFIEGGFPKEKIAVLPYGYSPSIYSRSGPVNLAPYTPHKGWRFLTVASPHKREGIETVLEAYRQAFSSQEDVTLLIKVNYVPGKKTKPFEYAALMELIEPFNKDPGLAPVTLTGEYFTENEMAALYRGASCLVSATRGEGFGMPFLESLAVGRPVIVTGWSGQMDFLTPQNAHLVDYTLVPAAEMQYDCQSTKSLIAKADVTDLSNKMRRVYDSRHKDHPPCDLQELEPYTWKEIATRFIEIVRC